MVPGRNAIVRELAEIAAEDRRLNAQLADGAWRLFDFVGRCLLMALLFAAVVNVVRCASPDTTTPTPNSETAAKPITTP